MSSSQFLFFRRKYIDVWFVSFIAILIAGFISLFTWKWLFYDFIQYEFGYNTTSSIIGLSIAAIVLAMLNYLYYSFRTIVPKYSYYFVGALIVSALYSATALTLYFREMPAFYIGMDGLLFFGYLIVMYNFFFFIVTLLIIPFTPTVREEVLLAETEEEISQYVDNWRLPPQNKTEEIGYRLEKLLKRRKQQNNNV